MEKFVSEHGLYYPLKFSKAGVYYYLFHLAAEKSNHHVLQFLISKGININLLNYDGKSALYCAIKTGSDKGDRCALMLLEAEAQLQPDVFKKILKIILKGKPSTYQRARSYFEKIVLLNIDIKPVLTNVNSHELTTIHSELKTAELALEEKNTPNLLNLDVKPMIFSSYQNPASTQTAIIASSHQEETKNRAHDKPKI